VLRTVTDDDISGYPAVWERIELDEAIYMGRELLVGTAVAAALLLTACSEAPQPSTTQKTEIKQEPPKPAGPVDAQAAFYEMYSRRARGRRTRCL
jgi:hypothetical protein